MLYQVSNRRLLFQFKQSLYRDKELLLRECRDELDELDRAMKTFLSENAALKKRIQDMEGVKESNEKGAREVYFGHSSQAHTYWGKILLA